MDNFRREKNDAFKAAKADMEKNFWYEARIESTKEVNSLSAQIKVEIKWIGDVCVRTIINQSINQSINCMRLLQRVEQLRSFVDLVFKQLH